jgi:hypothetical protein
MLRVALLGYHHPASGVNNAEPSVGGFFPALGLAELRRLSLTSSPMDYFGNRSLTSSGQDFWGMVGGVFSNPASYAVIFSLIFVNMFDTSATLMAIGRDTDIFGADGKMKDNKVIMADATGASHLRPLRHRDRHFLRRVDDRGETWRENGTWLPRHGWPLPC